MAERRRLPVFFHTGDTYSPRARLRFAQPLAIDDVAVDHPKACFVLAHLGNPWLTDAAEVVYKNVNVWADLSGFVVGGAEAFARRRAAGVAERDLRSPWAGPSATRSGPTASCTAATGRWRPMTAYRDFIASAIPEAHHSLVFEENARLLFRI